MSAATAATPVKDKRLAAVAQILEKTKKISGDGSGVIHRPVISGIGGLGSVSTSTGEKLSIEKIKRPVAAALAGNSGAPVKAKLMTVKLKPSQVAFKSTETKEIKK